MPPGEGAITLRTVVPFPAERPLPSSFPRNDTSYQRRVFPNISRTRRHRGPGSLSSPLLVPGCGLCSVLTRLASQGRHGPARMPPPGLTVKHPGNRHRRLSEAAAPVFSGCDVLDGSDLSHHRPQNCAGKKRSGLFSPSLLLTSLEWDRPPRFRISTIKTNALRFENYAFSRRTTLNCAPAFHALQTALGVARASGCPNDEEPLAGTLCLVEAPPFAAHSRAVTALPAGSRVWTYVLAAQAGRVSRLWTGRKEPHWRPSRQRSPACPTTIGPQVSHVTCPDVWRVAPHCSCLSHLWPSSDVSHPLM